MSGLAAIDKKGWSSLPLQRKHLGRFRGRILLLPLVALLFLFLCQCQVRKAHQRLSEARQEIDADSGQQMEGAALYHLTIARELLAAAEKQYEDADFQAARRFADEAARQVFRAERLYQMERQGAGSATGGAP
ncbi:MAG: hypothetical protein AB1640_05745 [bacterium]